MLRFLAKQGRIQWNFSLKRVLSTEATSSQSTTPKAVKSNFASEFLPKPNNPSPKRSHKPPPSSTPTLTKSQKYGITVGGIALALSSLAYLTRNGTEDDKLLDPDHRTSPTLYSRYQRLVYRSKAIHRFFTEPVANKLLPDPLPPGHQPPYTLVLNLHDTLVHSHWDRTHGWRLQLRPGVQYFLAYLSQFYEIVLFTSSQGFEIDPILDKVDPFGGIMYRLYREATRRVSGKLVKDLSYLNRDLSRTLIIDWNEESVSMQPENAILIDRWMGDDQVPSTPMEESALIPSQHGGSEHDFLIRLIPFLETVALSDMDVREVLKDYKDKNIPEAFAENMKKYQAQTKGQLEGSPKVQEGEPAGDGWGQTLASWTRTLFGVGHPTTTNPPSSTVDENDIFAQQKRHHEMFIQQIVEKQDEIEQQKKWFEEQQKKQMQYLSENKVKVWDLLTQGPPKELMEQLQNPQGYPGQQPPQQ